MVRGVREAVGRATAAVRTVATDARAERAALFASGLDAKRIDLLGAEATLKLFEKKGGPAADAELVEITAGWMTETERVEGEVESTFIITIAEQEGLTAEIMEKMNRVLVGDVLCSAPTWTAPHESPRRWTIFAREIKPGAVRR